MTGLANGDRRRGAWTRRLQASGLVAMMLALGAAVAQVPDVVDGPLQTNNDTTRVKQIDNDTIVRMAKAGLDDQILLQTIELQPGHYDVAPDNLITLKAAGVSERVIAAMQAHGTGLDPRMRPGGALAQGTPQAMGLDEFGVYYKNKNGEWVSLKIERVTQKSGGTLKSLATHGIISRDMNGHIDGARSPLKLQTGVEILIYAPAGIEGSEYDFIRFREHADNREFRTLTGGVFHSQSGADRDEVDITPKKIAPQLYTFTVPIDIEKGEYGVLPPASAGVAGTSKMYTFSIPE
jgi:hypothetical protein